MTDEIRAALSQMLLSTSSIDPTSGCRNWEGRRKRTGYGFLAYPGWKTEMGHASEGVHRTAYRLWVGDIPPGMVVRHRCDNPPCIRPHHLVIGTHADNAQDVAVRHGSPNSKSRHMARCINGHVMFERNTGRRPGGTEYCITCDRAVLEALAAEVGEVLT